MVCACNVLRYPEGPAGLDLHGCEDLLPKRMTKD